MDEGDMELHGQLRLEAFHCTWSKIQSTINEVLIGINFKLFDQVVQVPRWVQESFSAIRSIASPCPAEIQQPYPLLNDVICRKILTFNAVLDILRCFPCLEKLYVVWKKHSQMGQYAYDPLDPIKCLETHLNKIVLKNYRGRKENVNFARFFVFNAKVLQKIEFEVPRNYNNKWVANQHRLLQLENRASRDAQFEFRSSSVFSGTYLDFHNLSMVDSFDRMR